MSGVVSHTRLLSDVETIEQMLAAELSLLCA